MVILSDLKQSENVIIAVGAVIEGTEIKREWFNREVGAKKSLVKMKRYIRKMENSQINPQMYAKIIFHDRKSSTVGCYRDHEAELF